MKKFRLLAALLAILMLPVGLLVACDGDKDPDPNPGPVDPVDPDPGDGDGDGDGDGEDEVVYDNDGTKDGYLMFFNFDAAVGGNLNVKTKPYSNFFGLEVEDDSGIIYIVDKMSAKDKQSLLISRKDSAKSAKFDVVLKNIVGLSSSHTFEFDVRVSNGCITDDVSIVGTKGTTTQVFATIKEGGVYDAGDTRVYKISEEDEWINVALGINDLARTYTIYVNGEIVSADNAYNVSGYKGWADAVPDSYSFVTGENNTDFYFYVDNLGIVTGTKPMVALGENEKEIYTDIYDETLSVFNVTKSNGKVDYLAYIDANFANRFLTTPYPQTATRNKGSLKITDVSVATTASQFGGLFGGKTYKSNDGKDNNYSISFDDNEKLTFSAVIDEKAVTGTYSVEDEVATLKWEETADDGRVYERVATSKFENADKTQINFTITFNVPALGNGYAMLRYNEATQKFTQITYEYGFEKGDYSEYGAVFGNNAYKLDENNWIYFKSNGALEFVAKLNGKDIVGNYYIEGTEEAPEALLKWTEMVGDLEETKYLFVKYDTATKNISVADVYGNEGDVYALEAASALPFSGKVYGYTTAKSRLVLVVYDYLKKADLVIEGEGAVELLGASYTYENGVLTIANGDTKYAFTYVGDAEAGAYGTFTYGEKTFGRFDPWALMDGEKYSARYGSYMSMVNELKYTMADFATNWTPKLWETIKLRIYIPAGMDKYGYGLYFDCGSNNGPRYVMHYLKGLLKEGWNEIELAFSEGSVVREASKSNWNGSIQIKKDGWASYIGNVYSDGTYSGIASDEYQIIIESIEFVAERTFVVEGPAEGKEACTHEDADGNTLLVAQDTPVRGSCSTPEYYALKCSECGATKFDPTKPFVLAAGHNGEGAEVKTVLPTCIKEGYSYKNCVDCGEEIDIVPIEALGHINHEEYDSTTNMIKSTCKVCGYTAERPFIDKLMTGVEKMEHIGADPLTFSPGFVVSEGINTEVVLNNKGSLSKGILKLNPKGSVFNTIKLNNGDYGIEHKRTEQVAEKDPYFNAELSYKIKNSNFVFEMDMMLGDKGASGSYQPTTIWIVYHNPSTRVITIAETDKDGYLVTQGKDESGEQFKYKLSDKELTNVAFAVNYKDSKVNVYINGYKAATVDLGTSIKDIAISHMRVKLHDKSDEVGASMIYNDIFYYEADEPICVIEGDASFEKEWVGDVELVGAPATGDRLNVVSGTDVRLDMPLYKKTTKYVFDFTLKGELTDGVILKGHKVDAYRIENEKDLITVKGEYIYYLGTAICKTSDAVEGVRITLEVNDKAGSTVVYINGVAVVGGAIYYTEGYYGASDSYLVGYTFGGAVSSVYYEVYDVKMYTGALKTETAD